MNIFSIIVSLYVLPYCYHEDVKLIFLSIVILYLVNFNPEFIYYTLFTVGVRCSVTSKGLHSSLSEDILKKNEEDLEWFCGFAEAESLFFISRLGALSFRIKLHWDDRGTLVYIKNLLSGLVNREIGVIVDSKNQHESYYEISKFQDIWDVIIPIFSKYYFTTSKYLDFQDFKASPHPPVGGEGWGLHLRSKWCTK